jgi:CBS domain containing-hemolysin-like protein
LTYGKPLAIAIVTVGVAYVALVIGELAPKHIGLNNPETIAIRIARPLAAFARAAAPAIWLLNGSTRLLLRLVNLRPRFERALTEDDCDNKQISRTGQVDPWKQRHRRLNRRAPSRESLPKNRQEQDASNDHSPTGRAALIEP